MQISQQIATHFKQLYFGGNWTWVNMKYTLANVDWKQATTKIDSVHTVAELVFHTNYFVRVILSVLRGETLNAHDKYSFDLPPVESEEDWQRLLNKSWMDAEDLSALIEQLPDEKLWETFAHERYGNYYRNFHGLIEHTHYHLGQIVVIKKILDTTKDQKVTGKE